MNLPPPKRDFLKRQIRWAMGRGLPAQAAEDVVFEAWHKAAETFDKRRGSFEAYMQRIVRNKCTDWWRRESSVERAHNHLRLVPASRESRREERASRHQTALLAALDPSELAVFNAWALQRHLGKGRVTSRDMSQSLGMAPADYENAKRRLRTRIETLMTDFGWSVRSLLHGEDDVEQAG
jgi:DNA-directed RNA polymerase specialized sigma24 family protein